MSESQFYPISEAQVRAGVLTDADVQRFIDDSPSPFEAVKAALLGQLTLVRRFERTIEMSASLGYDRGELRRPAGLEILGAMRPDPLDL